MISLCLKKKKEEERMERDTHREDHVKTEAEAGVSQLQAKEFQ